MQIIPFRLVFTSVAFGIAMAFTGCQSYQSKPLDLGAHHSEWVSRTPADETIIEFAASLAETGDQVAANFDPSDGFSLAEAELVALVFNPDLRLARLRAGVASATAEHAGLWDDPELSIDVLRITKSVSSPWVITPGLAITIPISGRLGVEKARADASLLAELDRVAESEWQTRYAVRRAWFKWSAALLRVDETERLVTSMDSLVASTGRLAESGEIVRTEAALFAIEQMQRRNELFRLRGDVAEFEQRLRALLGLAPEAPAEFLPSLDPGLLEDLDFNDVAIAERNPTLVRLRQEYEVAEQTLRREIRKQYPDLTIGPLYESDQGQSRIGFMGGIPLPVLNANKQGIAESESERELASAMFETAYERLQGDIAAIRERAVALRDQRKQIATEIGPLVDQQLKAARQLLQLGEGSGLVLLESQVRAHHTRLQLVEVRLSESLAIVEIAFLIGPPDVNPGQSNKESTADTVREVRQ